MKRYTACLMAIVAIALASTMLNLTSCSSGGSDAKTNTKPSIEPIVITGPLPFNGSVAMKSMQAFILTDLSANEIYTISLHRQSGLASLRVPDATKDLMISCGTQNNSEIALIECAMLSNDFGELLFTVADSSIGSGATFQIDIRQGGIINEGSAEDPVSLQNFPSPGGMLSESYYQAEGLQANAYYEIWFEDISDSARFLSGNSTTFNKEQGCTISTESNIDKHCVIQADASGYIYIQSYQQNTPLMVNYSIMVAPYNRTTFYSEGSFESPINISNTFPYPGETGDSAYSIYKVTGLLKTTIYTISLQRLIGPVSLVVDNATDNNSIACGWSNPSSDLLIQCAMLTDASGNLQFSVESALGASGGLYTLNVNEGGIVNQGSQISPRELVTFPAQGSALSTSYYRASGLVANALYTFSVTDVSGDIAFFVYDSPLFQQTQSTCFLYPGVSEASCQIQATATGELYFLSHIQNEQYNAQYSLNLAEVATP